MKTQLIKLQDKFILVNDEEIIIGDTVIEYLINGKVEMFSIHTINDIDKNNQKKIISESPDFSLLSEEDCKRIGWVDVEKLLDVFEEQVYSLEQTSWEDIQAIKKSLLIGFKTAQSLNKEFSLEDMRRCYEAILVPVNIQDLLIGHQYLMEFDDGEDNHVLRFLYWKEDYYKIKRAWKQTQSLNDKMFSLEDMANYLSYVEDNFHYHSDTWHDRDADEPIKRATMLFNFKKSLQQTSWEVDVEIDTCLTNNFLGIQNVNPNFNKPKINADNSIKVLRIL